MPLEQFAAELIIQSTTKDVVHVWLLLKCCCIFNVQSTGLPLTELHSDWTHFLSVLFVLVLYINVI